MTYTGGSWWWHLSTTWKGESVTVKPRRGRVDDATDARDCEPCICVSPTAPQALVALGAWADEAVGGGLGVWVTQGEPEPAAWVFDYRVTREHRFYVAKKFIFVGHFDPLPFSNLQAEDFGDEKALATSLRRLRAATKASGVVWEPRVLSRASKGS